MFPLFLTIVFVVYEKAFFCHFSIIFMRFIVPYAVTTFNYLISAQFCLSFDFSVFLFFFTAFRQSYALCSWYGVITTHKKGENKSTWVRKKRQQVLCARKSSVPRAEHDLHNRTRQHIRPQLTDNLPR